MGAHRGRLSERDTRREFGVIAGDITILVVVSVLGATRLETTGVVSSQGEELAGSGALTLSHL